MALPLLLDRFVATSGELVCSLARFHLTNNLSHSLSLTLTLFLSWWLWTEPTASQQRGCSPSILDFVAHERRSFCRDPTIEGADQGRRPCILALLSNRSRSSTGGFRVRDAQELAHQINLRRLSLWLHKRTRLPLAGSTSEQGQRCGTKLAIKNGNQTAGSG